MGWHMYKLALGIAFGVLLFSNTAMATCSSYPYTLTNGTTADATQVMTDLNCAALTSGATLVNVAQLGIGMTPVSILDITQNQNNSSKVSLLNNSAGASASTGLYLNNGTHSAQINLFGTGYTTASGNIQDGMQIFTSGVGGLQLYGSPILFYANNSENARFGTDGSFLAGTTTNGGYTGNAQIAVQGGNNRNLTVYQTSTGFARETRINNTSAAFDNFNYNGSSVGTITSSGTTTAYNTTSDARLKNTAVPQRDYSDAIKQLWVGDFRWKKNSASGFGVLAQQTYPLFPGAVQKPSTATGLWMVDYGKLAPLALWGVKDLYAITDGQRHAVSNTEIDVKALRAQFVALKAANDNQSAEIGRLEGQVAALQRKVDKQTAQR
jgi:hypothetical protein